MAITAALVKELREKTGVGMMDCKKVLQETNGDIEAAIKSLREKDYQKQLKSQTEPPKKDALLLTQKDLQLFY